MRVITCSGYKGGISKSVTAVHLATFLASRGETILVDSDSNRTAIHWSERGALPFQVVDERRALKAVPGHDWVVVDTPARPDSSDLKELAGGSDLLILPTFPDILSLEPMLQMASDLGGVKYRILITRVPPKPNRDGLLMQAQLRAAGAPVFRSLVRQSVGFTKAALAGVPISSLTGRDRLGWLDYEAVGKEVLEVLGE